MVFGPTLILVASFAAAELPPPDPLTSDPHQPTPSYNCLSAQGAWGAGIGLCVGCAGGFVVGGVIGLIVGPDGFLATDLGGAIVMNGAFASLYGAIAGPAVGWIVGGFFVPDGDELPDEPETVMF